MILYYDTDEYEFLPSTATLYSESESNGMKIFPSSTSTVSIVKRQRQCTVYLKPRSDYEDVTDIINHKPKPHHAKKRKCYEY